MGFKYIAIEKHIEEKFQNLLEFAIQKKDASYIELFVSPIVAQKPALIGKFADSLLALVKLKEDGGPRTDLHRLRALETITKAIYKILQRKDDGEMEELRTYLKGTSKDMKKIIVSVAANHEQFKVKKIATLRKYLELVIATQRAYAQMGFAKRLESLKEAVVTVKKELPQDPLLLKQLKKVEEAQTSTEEEGEKGD